MRYLTGKFIRKPERPEGKPFGSQDNPSPDRQNGIDQSSDDLLRAELYPEVSPLQRPALARRVGLLLVLLAITASSWFCFLGPGSSMLESSLQKLAIQASVPPVFTFTPLDTGSPSPTSPTVESSHTPTIIPTSTSANTATPTVEPSPTPNPVQNTPTPTSEVAGCVPAELVTLTDVGKTLCVSGRVFRTIDKASSFIIVVVEEPAAFYFVAYDLKYPDLEKKQCIYATGEIRQLGFNPIMVLSYSNPLQYCSEP